MVSPTTGHGLPPRVLLWAVGASAEALQTSLADLARDAGHWSGVEVVTGRGAMEPSTRIEMPALGLRWHEVDDPRHGWAGLEGLRVPAGVALAWLVAGVRTPAAWIRPLQQALDAEPMLGTCSPLALGEPLFSPLPMDATLAPQEIDLETLNHWLRASSKAKAWALELGRPLLQAGLMRHEAWLAARASGDVPWPLAVARAGWVHGTSLRACVSAAAPDLDLQTGAEAALSLLADEALWRTAHPLTGLRHAVSVTPTPAWAGPMRPASTATAAPVRLHVMHSWGGGLNKWVREFCQADVQGGSGRGLLFKSVGTYGAFAQRLELHADNDEGAPLEVWELGLPIHATALAHLQVQQVLDEVIARYGVTQVLVSSLIGHSLDVLRTGLPTVLVMHDHHPYCVTLYAQFEGECRQCDRQKLQRCINDNPGHRFFRGVQADDWQALREAFVATVLRHRPQLVAPSRSVALRWQSLMPELQDCRVQVIEHGLNMTPAQAFEPPQGGPLRVVVLGRLSAEKGQGLLAEMLPSMSGWAKVLLLGCGEQPDPIKQFPHVTAVDHFDPADLSDQIAAWRPHLGLLTSTVPETFSYALSELWHCGVPVLACDLGALADRIRDGENGFLEPPSGPALLQRLQSINQDRAGLNAVRVRLQQQRARSVRMMLDDYAQALQRIPRTRPEPAAAQPLPLVHTPHPPGLRGPARWLHVSPEATWLQAARGFVAYTRRKAANSPRLPVGLRRWLKG